MGSDSVHPRPPVHPGLPADHEAALEDLLARADTAAAAAGAVVAHLAASEGLMPSLYLERGGRLRCQAVHGYWQIRDGMPPSAGVIGRTFRTGETTVERDIAGSPDYLAAASDVAAEICVPIRMGDAVVGVVNVECQRDLPDAFVAQLEACAVAYAARLTAMGGPPRSSPAQRLVEHVTELVGRVDLEEIELAVLEAALDVTSMDSAMLLREDAYGCSVPQRAVGPLAKALYACPPVTIAVIESFVDGGTSCYTVDQPGGGAPQGMRALRAAGAEALIALALGPEEGRRGLLIVARTTPGAPTTGEVELLELLLS